MRVESGVYALCERKVERRDMSLFEEKLDTLVSEKRRAFVSLASRRMSDPRREDEPHPNSKHRDSSVSSAASNQFSIFLRRSSTILSPVLSRKRDLQRCTAATSVGERKSSAEMLHTLTTGWARCPARGTGRLRHRGAFWCPRSPEVVCKRRWRWNRSVSEESDRHAEEGSTHTARHLSNGPWTQSGSKRLAVSGDAARFESSWV